MNEMSIKQFTKATQTYEVTCTCSNIYQTWQWLQSRYITKTALGEKPFNTFIARHLYISFNLQATLPHLQIQKTIGKNFIQCWQFTHVCCDISQGLYYNLLRFLSNWITFMGLWNIFITGSCVTSVTGAEKASPFHCTTPLQAATILFSLMKLIFTIQTHPHSHKSSYVNFRCTLFKKLQKY